MGQTFILIERVSSYCFSMRPIAPIKRANIQQLPEFEALKQFSDGLATLENHWETSPEDATRQEAKWLVGRGSENKRRHDWVQTTSRVIRSKQDKQEGIIRVHCSVKQVSLKSNFSIGDKYKSE